MTVERYPSLAHWGAFTAVVENGRVVGAEPFAHDPAPSAMLNSIPAAVAAAQKGERRGRGPEHAHTLLLRRGAGDGGADIVDRSRIRAGDDQ